MWHWVDMEGSKLWDILYLLKGILFFCNSEVVSYDLSILFICLCTSTVYG